MGRTCVITGKVPRSGNNVSHAHNKLKRRFLPNLQSSSFMSEKLNRVIQMKVSTSAIRTVEHNGGLDKYLLNTKFHKLSPQMQKLRREILSKEKVS